MARQEQNYKCKGAIFSVTCPKCGQRLKNFAELQEHYKCSCPAEMPIKTKGDNMKSVEELEKVEASAWEKYKKVEAPAWEEYEKVEAPALEEYKKVRDSALEEYEKVCAELEEAKKAKEGQHSE